MKKEKRFVSLNTKMNILLIVVILAISFVLVFISYRVYIQKMASMYTEQVNQAAHTSLDSIDIFLATHLKDIVLSDEFQQIRAAAEAAGDEDQIIEWMEKQPGAYLVDVPPDSEYYYSLYNEYMDLNTSLGTFRDNIGVTKVHIQFDQNGKVYNIVDPDLDIFSLGSIDPDPQEFKNHGENEYIAAMVYKNQKGRLCTACEPFSYIAYEDNDFVRKVGGYVCVDMDVNAMIHAQHWYLLNTLFYVAAATLTVIGVSMYLVNRTVVRPLKLLAEGTRAFANTENGYSDDAVIRKNITSNDEIGSLYHDIQDMQKRIVAYTGDLARVTAEEERLHTEMRLAKNIQESMLPSSFPAFPDRTEFDLYAVMHPARDIGGDFYDFFLIDDDHLCLVIADVSGKGIPAALFMMSSKLMIYDQAMTGGTPADILTKINQQLCRTNEKSKMFVTVWLGILDLKTGVMTCANAGHEYPCVRKDGAFTMMKDPHGFVVGGLKTFRYTDYQLSLKPGDAVFVYTDGVPEATNRQNDRYGDQRLTDTLNALKEKDCEQILSGMLADMDAFAGGAEQFDDITMLCFRYKGSAET